MDEKDEKEVEFRKNPDDLNGVEDLSLLVYLDMPNVLFNTMFRFLKMPAKEIYTKISCILIAINPYEWLNHLTSQEMIDTYKAAQDSGDLKETPHPYAVSSRAYVRMVQRGKPQSLLCCGISGAGKSECAKQLIRYLAKTSPNEMDTGGDSDYIVNQIVQASIILEAWGNAKTTLNNNSSRFGKFVKIMFKGGAIIGSWMDTYLLEKSRVITQGPKERNYHIFYFLARGLSAEKLKALSYTKPEDFWYLKQGGSTTAPGLDDKELFDEISESLKLFRFTDNDLMSIWEVTSGILHLGEVSCEEDDKGKSAITNTDACETAADLWGITAKALVTRLTTASMKVGGENITKDVSPRKFIDNRDAIAKALYENSFLFVVERINAELFHVGGDVRKVMFIGILDIFGFENFVTNSIEQFCINFTNEKIQGFFNYNIIQSEQDEYIKESVLWKPMDVPDNRDFIAMIEKKKTGMFAILDSACNGPKPTSESFCNEFFKRHGKMTKYLKKAKGPKSSGKKKKKKAPKKGEAGPWFLIHHFCDDVIYDTIYFLEKNMDAIHPDSAKMFANSTKSLCHMIGGGTHQKKKKKRKKKKSVTGFFSGQLVNLIKTLEVTEPYFCRAMKPNWNKSATEWDDVLVEEQLRSGGLVEALRVLKLGYPTRVPYKKIWDSFHGKIQNPLVNNLDMMGFSEVVLAAFDVDKSWYELGLTKIFFRPAKAACLDTIMANAGRPLSEVQNAKIEQYVKEKRMKQLVGTLKVYLKLAFRIRAREAQKTLSKVGRLLGYMGTGLLSHLEIAEGQYREAHAAELAAAEALQRSKDKEAAEAEAARLEKERLEAIEQEKAERAKKAAKAEALRLAKEKAQREKENSELWKLMHPVDSTEEEYEDEEGLKHVRKKVDFKHESRNGHLFTVYTANKSRMPHDRFVKCDWDGDKVLNISWGSGNRQMTIGTIKFVCKGIVTPGMTAWKDDVDDGHAFSVVCEDGRTLDLVASDDMSRDLWADGLTKQLGQTEEERAALQASYVPLEVKEDLGPVVPLTASQEETRLKLVEMYVLLTFKDFKRTGVYTPVCYDQIVTKEFDTHWCHGFLAATSVPWRHWEWAVRRAILDHCLKEEILDQDIIETVEDAKMADNNEYQRFMYKQEPGETEEKSSLPECKMA